MYKGGGAAEGAVIATKIVSENPESPPQAEYISFDDITHEHLVKADQRECMASVTEEDWENFRKLNSTIDYQQIYQQTQYNEFYGLDFATLKETIGEEKFLYYGFDTWTAEDWAGYQEFIKDLYEYNYCKIEEKYDFALIKRYPEFKERLCDENIQAFMDSVCMYGYYGTDMCQQEYTPEQLASIGLEGKSDQELGLGEYCVNVERIFTDFN